METCEALLRRVQPTLGRANAFDCGDVAGVDTAEWGEARVDRAMLDGWASLPGETALRDHHSARAAPTLGASQFCSSQTYRAV